MSSNSGPLASVRVIEFEALGPSPHCAMLLADLGAEVLTVTRADGVQGGGPKRPRRFQPQLRGRLARIGVDLKSASGRAQVEKWVERSDVLIEGFRPGVMERLSLGPETCMRLNPRLIYARITGWGQSGPWSKLAGHDINYVAASGLLSVIGRPEYPPAVPLNLLADYGGGSMFAAFGISSALFERERSGKGQVIDVAMSDGLALLGAAFFGAWSSGDWNKARQSNLLDGGAPWYDVYETADARFMAVGALEDQFYDAFVSGLGLDPGALPCRDDRSNWPRLRDIFTKRFRQRSFAEWSADFEFADACVTPVFDPSEAIRHQHAASRDAFIQLDGVLQPAAAPRFSRTGASGHHETSDGSLDDLADW